jgi:predicted nucleotidyltransferase
VEVLVECDGPTTFDRCCGVREALEDLPGAGVDLATPAMLKPRLKLGVDREALRVA